MYLFTVAQQNNGRVLGISVAVTTHVQCQTCIGIGVESLLSYIANVL